MTDQPMPEGYSPNAASGDLDQIERDLAAHLEAAAFEGVIVPVLAAEYAIEFLTGLGIIMPAERWDEQCHACEARIGDHLVSGRCPT